jgi:hypothetical protein
MPTPIDLGAAEALIRARILAVLNTVEGVGRTYDYFRHVTNEATTKALLKDQGTGALHFWFIALASEETLSQRRDGTLGKGTLTYEMHGYMAVNDAEESEKAFAEKALDVLTAFNGAQKLILDGSPIAGVIVQDSGPIQWPSSPHVMFNDVLCHYARLSLPVVFSVGDC